MGNKIRVDVSELDTEIARLRELLREAIAALEAFDLAQIVARGSGRILNEDYARATKVRDRLIAAVKE